MGTVRDSFLVMQRFWLSSLACSGLRGRVHGIGCRVPRLGSVCADVVLATFVRVRLQQVLGCMVQGIHLPEHSREVLLGSVGLLP